MSTIKKIHAREILDSRGNPTASETREIGDQSAEKSVYLESGELLKYEIDGDDNGIIDSSHTWSYQYDEDGRLRRATMVSQFQEEDAPVSTVVTYEYHPFGFFAFVVLTSSKRAKLRN